MNSLLPAWPLLLTFLFASFIYAITPGPCVIYIISRSLLQGRRFGLASVAGVALGNLGNAFGTSIGLAALFAVSSLAFMIIKYAGALYLVYLGVKALRTPQTETARTILEPTHLSYIFRDGFIVALLNPNTAVFFASFLPQFMSTEAAPILQGITLGTLFIAISAVTDTIYAVASGSVALALTRASGRYLLGGTFIGLGVFTAFSGLRSGK